MNKRRSYPIRPMRAAFADKNACKWKTNGFGDVPKSNSWKKKKFISMK